MALHNSVSQTAHNKKYPEQSKECPCWMLTHRKTPPIRNRKRGFSTKQLCTQLSQASLGLVLFSSWAHCLPEWNMKGRFLKGPQPEEGLILWGGRREEWKQHLDHNILFILQCQPEAYCSGWNIFSVHVVLPSIIPEMRTFEGLLHFKRWLPAIFENVHFRNYIPNRTTVTYSHFSIKKRCLRNIAT